MPSTKPILKLLDLIQSHRVTAVIYVAAKLGIAELLRDGPRAPDELAKVPGADTGALGGLDGDAEHSFKHWAIFEGQLLSKSWNGMLESIMTGKTAAQILNVANSFDLMARTPENVSMFNAAMTDLTRLVTPDVLRAYDFGAISHLLDVGGGSGELIAAVAKKYPNIRGTVFDLPRCAEAANHHFNRLGIADRAAFLAGDFFQSLPSMADAIILKSVIHDWNDERNCIILQNCRHALPKDGTLLT